MQVCRFFSQSSASTANRRYSLASVRTYAFDLLHFSRWLDREDLGLDAVDTDARLRYRAEPRPGQYDNVISLASGRAAGFAPAATTGRSYHRAAAGLVPGWSHGRPPKDPRWHDPPTRAKPPP
jgi:hypothetical protein